MYGEKKNKLSDCADREHIEKFEADAYHSADHDVRATAEIFCSMAGKVVGNLLFSFLLAIFRKIIQNHLILYRAKLSGVYVVTY